MRVTQLPRVPLTLYRNLAAFFILIALEGMTLNLVFSHNKANKIQQNTINLVILITRLHFKSLNVPAQQTFLSLKLVKWELKNKRMMANEVRLQTMGEVVETCLKFTISDGVLSSLLCVIKELIVLHTYLLAISYVSSDLDKGGSF